MEESFKGRVAVVIGGSSGIGRAAALAFAARGTRVAIGARRLADCEETVRQIRACGGEAFCAVTDVCKPHQILALIEATANRWRRLDFAFNNAGVEGAAFTPTAEYPDEVWQEVISVNLTGVFLSMKYEIRYMLQHGAGAIVNMSSIAGLTGSHLGCAYHASKHGVIGLTKAAALEYAKTGIRINAVCPAVIESPMTARIFGGLENKLRREHPLGRLGTCEEVAQAVLWLCSREASFIIGNAMPVDGGGMASRW